MATEPPHPSDRAVLGESWVMASTAEITEKQPQTPRNKTSNPNTTEETQEETRSGPSVQPPRPSPAPTRNDTSQSTESLASSSWTMAGPELVMPSISEVSISEASWVVPAIPQTPPSATVRKRPKPVDHEQPPQEATRTRNKQIGAGALHLHLNKPPPRFIPRMSSLYRDHAKLTRVALNGLLIAIILHLIALPELVYQFQGTCHIFAIKSLYPDSCMQLKYQSPNFLPPSSPMKSPEETISSSQQDLESIFDHTLQTLSPLSLILKQSETMLGELVDQLQSTFPEARNAFDLEFQGSGQALSAASWEFDSLRADLQSAVESLLASPPTHDSSGSSPSVARDTRVAVQLRRRAEYLDRLRSQICAKADSLMARFSTLDDHLEAVDGIVAREERRGSIMASPPGSGGGQAGAAGLTAVLGSLSSYASLACGLWSQSTLDSSAPHPANRGPSNPRPVTTLALLRLAATHHRPVADSVLSLSKRLRERRGQPGLSW